MTKLKKMEFDRKVREATTEVSLSHDDVIEIYAAHKMDAASRKRKKLDRRGR